MPSTEPSADPAAAEDDAEPRRRSRPPDREGGGPDHDAAGPLTPEEREDVEERANLRPLAIYEVVRQEGAEELARPTLSLWWSGLAAGLSIGLSVAAEGSLHALLPETPWRYLIESAGYTLGFIIVILARQQLFTEVTLTAFLPVLAEPSRAGFAALARNWAVVLAANMAGCALFAALLNWDGVLPDFTTQGARAISAHLAEVTPAQAFLRAILSGWLMALLVWVLPLAETARIWVIALITYFIALFELSHVVAGAVELFVLVFDGTLPPWRAFIGYWLPFLAGNIIGGAALFALLAHGQVREEMEKT